MAGPSKPLRRRKTPRACDYCRKHKLKCDFTTRPRDPPICKHCEDYSIICIVTARIKPPKTLRNPAAASSSSSNNTIAPDQGRWNRKHSVALTEPRYSGPTSLSQLVSAVTSKWPSRANRMLSLMDSRYGHQRVEGVSGGPFLMLPQVRYPPEHIESKEAEEARLSITTKKDLLKKYQRFIAPVFAILSNEESEAAVDLGIPDQAISTLSNLGLALLSVAAMTRDTPIDTRMSLLYHLRGRPQIEFSSSLETIQYLLLLSANIELLSPDSNNSAGMSLNLTGLVTRMAQDLGLHRSISQLGIPSQHLSRRARIWAGCIVQDRWYALSYGQPCLIHLEDCDAPGPSSYHDDAAGDSSMQEDERERPYDVHVEHAKLSTLMGRLLRLVFTPSGLKNTSVKDLEVLKDDLDRWNIDLPPSLQLSGQTAKDVNIGAGFLHLLKVGVDFIFYRAALVSAHNTSKSPSMSPAIVWEDLIKRSVIGIEWVATENGTSVLDCWSIAMYALIQCCLIQFYAVVSGEDPGPLRLTKQVLQSWSSSTETQSHGYYDPQEGDEPLPSSTTTASATPSTSTAKGKKSLTLRTKAYTLIAMLTGIAEHHVANRPRPMLATPPIMPPLSSVAKSDPTTTATMPMVHNPSLPLPGANLPTSHPTDTTEVNNHFGGVLNPNRSRHSWSDQGSSQSPFPRSSANAAPQHSFQVDPQHQHQQQQPNPNLNPNQNPNHHHLHQQQQYQQRQQYQQQYEHPIPVSQPSYSSMPASLPIEGLYSGVEQIDLITLQRWADEVMNNPPNLEMRYYPTDIPSTSQLPPPNNHTQNHQQLPPQSYQQQHPF